MTQLPRHIERHFQKNYQRHAFADELLVKVQRVRGYFTGDTLPFPTAEVITAWEDLPNITVDALPLSMRVGFAFLHAPPPTPTEPAFDVDDATSSESSFSDSQESSWVFVNDTDTPQTECSALRGPTTSHNPMSRCTYPDQNSKKQNMGKKLLRWDDMNSASAPSKYESLSTGSRAPLTPVGFHNIANQWFLDYRACGAEHFVDSLIAFGVVSPGTASLASRIARAIIRMVAKMSYTEGKDLENTLRFSALTSFKKCWDDDSTWMKKPSIPFGIRIACFIGSLFNVKVSTARDVHLCLSFLLEGEKRFDRLCAMHALLVQANDKLCKSRNLPALTEFRRGLTSVDEESEEYLWDTTPLSKGILTNILETIERWMATQALRREQPQTTSGNYTVRNRAVGPRLRGD